jgi:hypothetical protein
MWEASVLAGQLLASQEGSSVGSMAKESSINFWQGRHFLPSSKHPDDLEGQASHLFSLFSG